MHANQNIFIIISFSCGNEEITPAEEPSAFRGIKSISYNNVNVDVVIDKPAKRTRCTSGFSRDGSI